MGHIHYNALVPVFRVWGVPKTSLNDDVHPEFSVCSEGFHALYLMGDIVLVLWQAFLTTLLYGRRTKQVRYGRLPLVNAIMSTRLAVSNYSSY